MNTTLFIKKAVMTPIEPDLDLSKTGDETTLQNPFKRGIMQFDDYNYNSVNPYVLKGKNNQPF